MVYILYLVLSRLQHIFPDKQSHSSSEFELVGLTWIELMAEVEI